MKLIEGLKMQKDLARKVDDLRKKIQVHASYSSIERPVYQDKEEPDSPKAQTEQVRQWVQSCGDIVKMIANLRLRVQYTNLITPVTIELGGKKITKTIAEWIHWRRDFADMHYQVHSCLTDKNIREGIITNTQNEKVQVNIVRCYEPAARDASMELYRSMKYQIDSTLEIVNATTEMVETLPELKGESEAEGE